jgi:hypothetical protein
MPNNPIVLGRILNIVRHMEDWPYRDSDYGSVRERLEADIEALKAAKAGIRKAPLYLSETKTALPGIEGFLITREHVKGFIGLECSVTFYDRDMIPRYRKGVITHTWPRRMRIETLSGRGWYFQYSRIIRIEVFRNRRLLKVIWYNLVEN